MLEGILITMNCWKIKHDCLILNVILRVDSGVRGEKREDISIGGLNTNIGRYLLRELKTKGEVFLGVILTFGRGRGALSS